LDEKPELKEPTEKDTYNGVKVDSQPREFIDSKTIMIIDEDALRGLFLY
jgi:hypothetical protein